MTFEEFLDRYQKAPVEEYGTYTGPVNPLLSVHVHTYNHAPYIDKCLKGILAQKTTFDFEICIGDDESGDGTTEICKWYADKYPDLIRLFINKRANNIKVNGEPTGKFNGTYTRNQMRGKYIAFVEGDDYWTDTSKLQKQVDFLENNPEYSLTFHDIVVCDADGRLLDIELFPEVNKKDCSAEKLMAGFWVTPLTLCFRNIKDLDIPDEQLKVLNGDKFLTTRLGLYGGAKYLSEIEPAVYRVHGSSNWSSRPAVEQNYFNTHTFTYLAKYFSRIGKKDIAAVHAKNAKKHMKAFKDELSQGNTT